MGNKDMAVYKPGEYLNEEKVVKQVKAKANFLEIGTLGVGIPYAVSTAFMSADFVTGGITTGLLLAFSTASHVMFQSMKVESAMHEAGLPSNKTALPRGSWKSLLPFGHKLFPLEVRVEATVPKANQSKNIALSEDDPRNQKHVSYIVKKGKGGIKVYDMTLPDPMESWDSLFVQETGYAIDRFRPGTAGIYRQLDSPKILDVATAKVRVALDAGQGRQSPIWLKNLASRPLK